MGQLAHNLLVFARLLRAAGVTTDPERVRLSLRAVERAGLGSRSSFYRATRATLVYRRQDLSAFDQLFAAFWRRRALEARPAKLTRPPRLQAALESGARRGERTSYSDLEVLRAKDFGELSEPELVQVRRMIAELGWRLGERISRRRRSGAGRLLDHRRSWRANMRFGGEPMVRVFRRRLRKPRPLVLIADVSGSMERYSSLMLHLAHGLVRSLSQPVEAFVFSTRLSRITRQLRLGPAEAALQSVSGAVPDWSGGTRIGEALRDFNYRWARRTLGHGAVVAVISDGLDRGRVDFVASESARLRRSCHRLFWLNPLLGSPDYRPLARGMQAALPHIDHFLPIHNLLSMEQFADRIRRVTSSR